MRFSNPIALDVYVYEEDEEQLESLGINNNVEYEDRTVTFFFLSLDYVVEYKHDSRMSEIRCSGESYVVKADVPTVLRMASNGN